MSHPPLLNAVLCLLLRIPIRFAYVSRRTFLAVVPAVAAVNFDACLSVLAFIAPHPVKSALRSAKWARGDNDVRLARQKERYCSLDRGLGAEKRTAAGGSGDAQGKGLKPEAE